MSARDIDLATVRTWPAAETEDRDGWLHLAAGGVTGRVNAVWPLDWRGSDVEAAIDAGQAWLAARNLPPRFKLTDGAYAPLDLAQRLARRGYQAVSPTLIMTAPIEMRAPPHEVALSASMPEALDAVLRAVSADAREYEERRAIALRAPKPAAFAMAPRKGAPLAIGMSAAAGEYAGLFLMRTAPQARRKGWARAVLTALMAQARLWGARTAFLQVDADNAPAIALYESEGFTTLSTYRFWRKP